jgi:positive regulator of sigma E activity
MEAAVFARMVAICYLLPPILMLAGAGLGAALVNEYSDLWALAGAASGLMVGYALLRLYDSRLGNPVQSEQPGATDRKFPVSLTES